MTILAHIGLVAGVFFALLGVVGTLRFPDVYTRLQASSKCSTTALLVLYVAAMLLAGDLRMAVRIFALLLFTLVTAPLGSHAIGRSAYECGILPWRGKREPRSQPMENSES